jgi:DegV family protein with EDD domain
MRPIKLFTDSTSDLPQEIIKQKGIAIIPLYVNFGTESFRDNVDIKPARLFEKVSEKGKLPMTSAPTVADFAAQFKKYIERDMDILHISISSKISSSFQNACTAASQFPAERIKVIDSLSLSSGIGLLVLIAADSIDKGSALNEVVRDVQSAVPKVRIEFVLDTVEYLHKGGRCSGLQMLLSSLLEIHPVITVAEGSIHLASKIRGKRQIVLQKFFKDNLDKVNKIDSRRIIIANCECPVDILPIKDQLVALNKFQQVLLTEASCVIASHCGTKTVGIFYLEK